MEAEAWRKSGDSDEANYTREWRSSKEPLITDAVLSEIMSHSTACVICALDEWDEEDWD